MRVALPLMLLLLAGCTSPEAGPGMGAGKGGIEGVAVDGEYQAAQGTVVQLEETGQSSTTDEQGRFWFRELDPGPYHLTAGDGTFQATLLPVQVEAGEWTEVVFELRRIDAAAAGTLLRITASGLEFSPSGHEASLADLPLTLMVDNGNPVPHRFAYKVVCRCEAGDEVLHEDVAAVPPDGSKRIPLPLERANRTAVHAGGQVVEAERLEARFSEADFAAAVMTGRITFKA